MISCIGSISVIFAILLFEYILLHRVPRSRRRPLKMLLMINVAIGIIFSVMLYASLALSRAPDITSLTAVLAAWISMAVIFVIAYRDTAPR